MFLKPGEGIYGQLALTAPDGTLVDADALPTCLLYRNNAATGVTVTVTKPSTGRYIASATLPSGGSAYTVGDTVQLVWSYTQGGSANVLFNEQTRIETSGLADLASTLSTIAGYIDTEVAAIKAKTDNLPASPAAVGSVVALSTANEALMAKLVTMVNSTPAFTAPALALAPTGGGGSAPTVQEIVDGLFGELVETGVTFGEFLEAVGSVLAGNVDTDTGYFKALGNSGTNRVHYVIDSDGNRTITLAL